MFGIGKLGLLLGVLALALAILGTAVIIGEPNVAAQSKDDSGLTSKGLGL